MDRRTLRRMRRTAIVCTALAALVCFPLVVMAVLLVLMGWVGVDPLAAVLWTMGTMVLLACVNIAFLVKTRND